MDQPLSAHNATPSPQKDADGKRTLARRRFLKSAAAAVAAPYFVPSSVLAGPDQPGANDRLRIGVIGAGNRVAWLLNNWGDPGQFHLAAIADCYAKKLSAFVDKVKPRFAEAAECPTYED